MESLADRIKDLVNKQFPHRGGRRQAAEKIGITPGQLSLFSTGKQAPGRENIEKIAAYFGVTVDYLLTGQSPLLPKLPKPEPKRTLDLDVQGVVSAGGGIDDPAEPGEVIEVDRRICSDETAVAYRVRGDSMLDASIEHGDYLLVRPAENIAVGEIVVVYVPDMGTLVKLKQHVNYSSINHYRTTEPIPRTPQCREYGLYVGVVRKFPPDLPKGKAAKKSKGKR
jgi:SOS-response transcriptional repressor LexA